jgi:hypothetical protein
VAIDWSNEFFARLYKMETDDDLLLSWEARAVWHEFLKKCDRSGLLTTKRGVRGVAALLRIPLEVVERVLQELLEDGRMRSVPNVGFVAPNYIEANYTPRSDKARQAESRLRRREDAVSAGNDQSATGTLSRDVTGGHATSQPVTHISTDQNTHNDHRSAALPPTDDIGFRLESPERPKAKQKTKRRDGIAEDWTPREEERRLACELGLDCDHEAARVPDLLAWRWPPQGQLGSGVPQSPVRPKQAQAQLERANQRHRHAQKDQRTVNESIHQLEKSVIGAVVLNPDNLALLPTLEIADFSSVIARTAWSAIRNLEAKRHPIDVSTIGDEASRILAQKLEENEADALPGFTADVFAYLGECALNVPTAGNAIEYARRLKDYSLRRRLVVDLTEILATAKADQCSGAEMLSAVAKCASLFDAEQPEDGRTIGVISQTRLKELERLYSERERGGSTLTGFPTGIEALDVKTGGWQPGIVSIVAARPAMGKSSLGLATADVCSSKSVGVHIFSLEDAEGPYADRSMSPNEWSSGRDIAVADAQSRAIRGSPNGDAETRTAQQLAIRRSLGNHG